MNPWDLVYLPTFWLVFSGSNMVNVGKYTKTWMLWVWIKNPWVNLVSSKKKLHRQGSRLGFLESFNNVNVWSNRTRISTTSYNLGAFFGEVQIFWGMFFPFFGVFVFHFLVFLCFPGSHWDFVAYLKNVWWSTRKNETMLKGSVFPQTHPILTPLFSI